jgi:GNAT superfamily N-acetyltransferase
MTGEAANRRINLAHHRIVARALKGTPELIDEARAVVDTWSSGAPYPPAFVKEWRHALALPADAIRREIVRHTPQADRLRGCSPFALIPSWLLTLKQVRRFWRMSTFYAMRLLRPSEYADYAAHLKRLDRKDRILRFCQPVTDQWIDRFVEAIGTDAESVVIGHYDTDLGLDGALHLALLDRDDGRFAETGLSVLPEARHRGIGYHLLERGLLWARNHGASRYYSLCAAGNQIMFKLARAQRMAIDFTEEGLVEGIISINGLTMGSLSLEILEDQIGEWDYNLKAHRTAFSFVAGRGLAAPAGMTDLERLIELAAVGGIDVITTYIIVFRYALVYSGASAEDHTASLAGLRARLEPLMARDPDLWFFAKGLPSAREGTSIRCGAELPASADAGRASTEEEVPIFRWPSVNH